MPGSWLPEEFPNLQDEDRDITSAATSRYNCIAWAADDSSAWWEPDPDDTYYWPVGAPRNYTMLAFIEAFRTKGYEICESGSIETGFEKVALYANTEGEPQHAARQLRNGKWTSKLGPHEDIEHTTLECLNGDLYGRPVLYLVRRLR
jgi:hypothetical protein